jgi:hypothetical protein
MERAGVLTQRPLCRSPGIDSDGRCRHFRILGATRLGRTRCKGSEPFGIRIEDEIGGCFVAAFVKCHACDGSGVVKKMHERIEGAFNGERVVIIGDDGAVTVTKLLAEILEIPHRVAKEPPYRCVERDRLQAN